MAHDRFSRWSTDGMPEGDAAFRVQCQISRVMRDVIQDAYKGISKSASMIPDNKREETPPRAPGAGSVPLSSPPGVSLIDQLCDAQDRRDRLLAAQQAAELREIEKRLAGHNPYKARTEYNPIQRFDKEQASLHRNDHD